MIGIRPKQLARLGQFYLEEAVLDVLLQVAYDEDCIGPAEISRRAGIFRDRGKVNIMNDAIVVGLLVKLDSEGKVKRCKQNNGKTGGWELTQIEFENRKDD